MAATKEIRPIIIKRKKVVASGGHHGGAWKVAYADFVTAMMAFFLLMWLLGATDEKKRQGLADYFNPTLTISRTTAGGGAGMLEGKALFVEAPTAGTEAEGVPPKPTHREDGPPLGNRDAAPDIPLDASPDAVSGGGAVQSGPSEGEDPKEGVGGDGLGGDGLGAAGFDAAGLDAAELGMGDLGTGDLGVGDLALADPDAGTLDTPALDTGRLSADEIEALAAEQAEQERLEAVGKRVAQAMREAEDGALERHFFLRITAEGLVIEIIDSDDQPLFASASAKPAPLLRLLIDVLVPVLGETTNDIAVVGHTDAVPFGGADYSNWELSADRANAARRMLTGRGLPEARISRVSGKAAVEPLVVDRTAPQNRRIAITLLRDQAR